MAGEVCRVRRNGEGKGSERGDGVALKPRTRVQGLRAGFSKFPLRPLWGQDVSDQGFDARRKVAGSGGQRK
jgi:hypothetical protein